MAWGAAPLLAPIPTSRAKSPANRSARLAFPRQVRQRRRMVGKKRRTGRGPKSFYAVVTPGLEQIAVEELQGLGVLVEEVAHGGVEFLAPLLDGMRVNLHARTIERVWLRMDKFRARSFPELYKKAARLDWSRFIGGGRAVDVTASAHNSRLVHSGRIASTVQDGLVDSAGAAPAAASHPVEPAAGRASGLLTAKAKSVDRSGNPQLVLARLVEDRCTLSLDMSGPLLHQRGYRVATGPAPLRETRAAALLRWVGWDPSTQLVDLCCGSGTFVIEAALMAHNRAPGGQRAFAFESWPKFDVAGWKKLRTLAGEAQRERESDVTGSDISQDAVDAARANAGRANLVVQLLRQDFRSAASPGQSGLVVANPPYGKRVGGGGLVDLYKDLARSFLRFGGWRGLMLTSRRELLDVFVAELGVEPAAQLRFRHGGLRVAASWFDLPHGAGGT